MRQADRRCATGVPARVDKMPSLSERGGRALEDVRLAVPGYCVGGGQPPSPRLLRMILSIGDLVLDITIVPEGRLRPDDDNPAVIRVGGGGQAANYCAWAAALGSPVRLVTRVGDDDRGRRLVTELETVGVEVFAVWGSEPTGMIA